MVIPRSWRLVNPGALFFLMLWNQFYTYGCDRQYKISHPSDAIILMVCIERARGMFNDGIRIHPMACSQNLKLCKRWLNWEAMRFAEAVFSGGCVSTMCDCKDPYLNTKDTQWTVWLRKIKLKWQVHYPDNSGGLSSARWKTWISQLGGFDPMTNREGN